MGLSRLLRREQRAFLGRDRQGWGAHLERVRNFLGRSLQEADPQAPVLILGAGTGLEVPWSLAPRNTTGWDADPLSRLGTLLRHRRFPPWVFQDVTGCFGPLEALAHRCLREGGCSRSPEAARRRLSGLLPSLESTPAPLQAWIQCHQPGTILAANLVGQLGVVAQAVVESAFHPHGPWEEDPEAEDLLARSLEAWARRVVEALLEVLEDSGARLCLVHDRAVLVEPVPLGPFTPDWREQFLGAGCIEVEDPLGGMDVREFLGHRPLHRGERWWWTLGPGQTHLIEALEFL